MHTVFSDPVARNVTLYGRTAAGLPLTESRLWRGEKSLLIVTGFCAAERDLSCGTEAWFSALRTADTQGDSFLGFDLKSLKKKGEIRLISRFDPSIENIYRNGMDKNEKTVDMNGFSENLYYNFRGVDLYRNFGADWVKLHRNSVLSAHCGPFPESESEVAAFTAHLRKNPPQSVLLFRHGKRGLYYPLQAAESELREAQFLARYASLPLFPCREEEGTPLLWLTDRGIKTLELRTGEEPFPFREKFLTMCVALL